jgi:hypothetical protein
MCFKNAALFSLLILNRAFLALLEHSKETICISLPTDPERALSIPLHVSLLEKVMKICTKQTSDFLDLSFTVQYFVS